MSPLVPPAWLQRARAPGVVRPVLVVAAHPDDECVGLGGQLGRVPELLILHLTDGAPRQRRWWGRPDLASREAYATLRRRELVAALAVAGIGEPQLMSLALPDQEASANLVGLTSRLAEVIESVGCDVVLTHPYEGGHPDHDAACFAVAFACRLVAAAGGRAPRVLEFTSYHAAADGSLATSAFLPTGPTDEFLVQLTRTERERKLRMLAAFASQRDTLRQFRVGMERVRPAPRYDFTAAPHPGTLFYERFDWGVRGDEWRSRAHDALHALGFDDGSAC